MLVCFAGMVLPGSTKAFQRGESGIEKQSASTTVLFNRLNDARAIDGTDFGKLYIVERAKSRLLITDTTGIRIDSIGNLGFGNYQFDQPVDVDVTNGLKIYIADQGNRRIQVLDRRLQFLTSIQPMPQSTEQPYEPLQITTNAFQELFFYNGTTRKIVKINDRGEEAGAFGFNGVPFEQAPLDVSSNAEWLWILDHSGKQLHTFSTGGTYIKFWELRGQAIAIKWYQNSIWVLEQNKIRQLNPQGRTLSVTQISISSPVVDFCLIGSTIYVLSKQGLFKIH